MQLLTPTNFSQYQLIDSGNFEKLERWGSYITCRPEPQAIWDKRLSNAEWQKQMHVKFVSKSSSSGIWQNVKNMPQRWQMSYDIPQGPTLQFKLALTSFKHVGLFPEQAVNWDFIYHSVKQFKTPAPKVLNLFAYTGASSLAACAAGADVTHLDSIKQVVTWARENMELSNLNNIRWMVEDAVTYAKREVKRGKKYNGIILDPPAFGHGPNGESWKLEDQINQLLKLVAQLLDDNERFLVLNTYSLGLSSLIINNMMADTFKTKNAVNTGEIFLQSSTQQQLPLGVFGRFCE
ncbi:MAG: class I SAM-dependent methyltransferase [Bacteroidia bacterium]|nr:class I SAM-dependent methyltransferase [Bacteroidia bacterium]HQU99595.1 class I SAM-dependent methyltransferase [Bacteroidia bacterium]